MTDHKSCFIFYGHFDGCTYFQSWQITSDLQPHEIKWFFRFTELNESCVVTVECRISWKQLQNVWILNISVYLRFPNSICEILWYDRFNILTTSENAGSNLSEIRKYCMNWEKVICTLHKIPPGWQQPNCGNQCLNGTANLHTVRERNRLYK